MSQESIFLRRSTPTLAVLFILALSPLPALGCSCRDFVNDWGFVTAGGLVPLNSRGLLWWGKSRPSNNFSPVEITRASGEALEIEFEQVSGVRESGLWLFRPRGGFQAGQRYIFTTRRLSTSRFEQKEPEVQQVEVVVSEEVAQAPATPVRLKTKTETIGSLQVEAGAMCSARVDAAQLPIAMELPQELERFRHQLYFETTIDGTEPWEPSSSLCKVTLPGVGWRGAGVDLLYRVCAGIMGRQGLAAGPHVVEMRAGLPGTDVQVTTQPVKVELHCPGKWTPGRRF